MAEENVGATICAPSCQSEDRLVEATMGADDISTDLILERAMYRRAGSWLEDHLNR
jgi:hypothetical protein